MACVLIARILIPSGFMPVATDHGIVISICSGSGPTTMVMTIPGLEHDKSDGGRQHGKTEQPCAFSGLSAPSLAAVGPVLLLAAALFALQLGIRPTVVPASVAPAHLRPPLRGPPAY